MAKLKVIHGSLAALLVAGVQPWYRRESGIGHGSYGYGYGHYEEFKEVYQLESGRSK